MTIFYKTSVNYISIELDIWIQNLESSRIIYYIYVHVRLPFYNVFIVLDFKDNLSEWRDTSSRRMLFQ
jgi:hypothetical protein